MHRDPDISRRKHSHYLRVLRPCSSVDQIGVARNFSRHKRCMIRTHHSVIRRARDASAYREEHIKAGCAGVSTQLGHVECTPLNACTISVSPALPELSTPTQANSLAATQIKRQTQRQRQPARLQNASTSRRLLVTLMRLTARRAQTRQPSFCPLRTMYRSCDAPTGAMGSGPT